MENQITAKQALDLSKAFDDAAISVGDYLSTNFNILSREDRDNIRSLRWTLFDLAEEMEQRAIGTTLTSIEGEVGAINGGIAAAKRALATVGTVGNAIDVISSMIDLAVAVNSRSPVTIVEKLNGLYQALGKLLIVSP